MTQAQAQPQATSAPASPAAHYASQALVAAAMAREAAKAWRVLDPARLAVTIPRLAAVLAAQVQRYGQASAGIAAAYYEAARESAGVPGRITVPHAEPAGLEQVTAGVRWATRDLWRPDYAGSLEPARVMTQGVAEGLVLDAGRGTLIGAVSRDRQASGWARHVEPGACAFCAMLATRGPAYRSRETAGFQSHPHCRCQPVPVFGRYEAPAHVRQWEALWKSSTKGKSGAAARKAFRQALEGREVTDARKAASKQAALAGERHVAGRPESHVRAELAALEKSHAALRASGSNPAAEAWQAARIAKLRGELG